MPKKKQTHEELKAILDQKGYTYTDSNDGLAVNHQGSVNLRSLTTLPENTKFENQGSVNLRSLTTLPENTKFENQGYVNLESLTTLPENTKFENQGYVNLESLDHKSVIYQGKRCTIRHMDGNTMIVTSTKVDGGTTIMRARYFKGGAFRDLPKSYIAQIGDYYAHGESIQQAVSDARFKHLQATMDIDGVVAQIKKDEFFTRETFRLLTGACSFGVEQFLKEHGLSDQDKLSIAKTVRATRGAYGGDAVQHYFGDV